MKGSLVADSRRSILLSLGVLAIITAILVLPFGLRTEAGRDESSKGLFTRTLSQRDDLPNYDIRTDKSAFEKLASFRTTLNRSAVEIADVRDSFVKAESNLKSKVPNLKVEYNPEIRTPEVIAPDASLGRALLSKATSAKRSAVLVNFLKENKGLVGATEEQLDGLKLFSDYKNPEGDLSFVEYNQEINGIPVFRGEVKAAFTKNGEIVRVINNIAPGLEYDRLSTSFNDPADAVAAAARSIKYDLKPGALSRDAARSSELKTVFGEGDWATTAEKMYFPTEPGVAVAAWRVLIWQPERAFYVIVDAGSGDLLWRKNITEDQSQSATYQVYTSQNAMINVADSPAPASPTVFDPNLGTQGLPIPRTNVTRIGNESPYNFNNNGWITDGFDSTDGNAVESGLDLAAPDGVDAGSQAVGNPFRTYSSLWNPPPGIPGPGEAPTTDEARRGAVIQQFYIMNLYHDEMYRLGFTESARNFQTNNFGRGGVGNDRISAEGQDSAGINNANFSSPADGARGKMQMFVFTGPLPDRDGSADAEIMIHEATHGLSNRLVGNSGGLESNMARSMGEGWSDFYAHCLLSESIDPIGGTHTLSGYLLLDGFGVVGTKNYYYGIRRFPKAIMSATGGPNNRPFNPLTFEDIDQTKINVTDGAFPAMSGPHISTNADQVHAAGEIWSSALWEVRARLVQRLGWATGNRRVLQLVTDGLKISPLNPTFLQARDAIVSAAIGNATTQAQLADASDVWAGFAIRGMGVSASIQNIGLNGTGEVRVTQAFDRPNLIQLPNFTISDAQGDNDGIFEPGETLVLTVPLTNNSTQSALNTTGDIPGAGSSVYGTIADSTTTTRTFNYTVPTNTPCGALVTLTMNVNSSLGAKSIPLPVPVGLKSATLTENFDSVGVPNLPSGWTGSTTLNGIAFVTSTNSSHTAPNAAFTANANFSGGAEITSPSITVNSAASTVTFRNSYNTESTWDGGVLEISIAGGAFVDVIQAGGSFIENGYNGTLGNGTNNPVANRPAWTGFSNGFIQSTVQLPPSANGQNIRLRWRFGTDSNTGTDFGFTGWSIDTVTVRATSSCSFASGTVRSRADFDGDGKTDLSIFRPSDNNWYLAPSLGGITVITWGVSGDEPTPGDFDGDGKADLAIFRPTAGSTPDFFILQSNGYVINNVSWGDPGDRPVIGDYDGDGKDDVAVYRQSDNNWYVVKSTGGLDISTFGQAGDVPVPGKFDADAKTDRAVYRNGVWVIANSTGGTSTANWGEAGDRLVPADYDGDNKDDIAVWRPSTGFWYIRRSTNFQLDIFSWGQTGDIPAPGDYDGDGKDDPAVYRNGTWYEIRSTQGIAVAGWGVANDVPIPSKYIP
ncbi:MAG: M36 family metallopeptidase [Pyrinomonadaceae bacterium]